VTRLFSKDNVPSQSSSTRRFAGLLASDGGTMTIKPLLRAGRLVALGAIAAAITAEKIRLNDLNDFAVKLTMIKAVPRSRVIQNYLKRNAQAAGYRRDVISTYA
jgi:hypothetical protein